MSHPVIDEDTCIACGICCDVCPNECLEIVDGLCVSTNEDACTACGDCIEECPLGSILEIAED